MHLLKTASCAGTHTAPWGRKGALFEEAHASFLRTAPRSVVGGKEPPSQKSLEGRSKAVVVKWRKEVKRTAGASRIVEVDGERETVLEDLILEINEHMEQEDADKEDRQEKEKRLTTAGVELRNMALSRGQGRSSRIEGVDVDGDRVSRATSPSTTGSKTRSRIHYEPDDDASGALVRDMAVLQQQENRRLRLDEQQYELEKSV